MKLKKAVVLNDTHIPYQDRTAVNLVLRYIKDEKPDEIILNGDICDCAEFSKFTLPLQFISWHEERKQLHLFLKQLSKFNVKYIYGNHEYRIVDEAARQARATGVDLELRGKDIIAETLGLGEFENITPIKYMGTVPLGDLTVKHGTYWRNVGGMSGKAEREKLGSSTLTGHVHRMGSCPITQGDAGNVHGSWENGCLCALRVWYKRGNSVSDEMQNWQLGFSTVYYEDKTHGYFNVQQYYIVKNKFVAGNGRIYQ